MVGRDRQQASGIRLLRWRPHRPTKHQHRRPCRKSRGTCGGGQAYATEQAQRAAILAKYKALDDEWKAKHPLGLAEEYRLARKRHEDARGVKTRVRNSDQRAVSL